MRPRRLWTPPLERSGRPWWPHNEAEIALFAATWCQRCRRQSPDSTCPVFAMGIDPTAPPPPEWVHNPNGLPWCKAFERRPLPGETGSTPTQARPSTPTLFD